MACAVYYARTGSGHLHHTVRNQGSTDLVILERHECTPGIVEGTASGSRGHGSGDGVQHGSLVLQGGRLTTGRGRGL